MEEVEREQIKKITESTEDIVETYRKLLSLTLVEYTSLAAGISAAAVVYMLLIAFSLLFASMGVAWWIGQSMTNMTAGFFIVALIFALSLLVVILTAGKKIISLVRDLIIREMYDKD